VHAAAIPNATITTIAQSAVPVPQVEFLQLCGRNDCECNLIHNCR
jgi:hypothetical protein